MSGSFEPRRLRYFLKVAELGSLTRAAEALHVAQPALSQQMRTLEEELGVQLFERGPRGVALTDAGQRMRTEAAALLGGMKALVERVKAARDPEGEVVIGVGQTIGSVLMVPLLELAAERLPRVRIQVREMLSGLLPELVRSGAVDFAISYNTASGNGIEAVAVLEEEMCLVGQRRLVERHLGTKRSQDFRFRDIAGLPLFLSRRGHILRELVERAARARNVELNIVAEIDSLYIMKELALGGTGCCVLSRANLRRELEHHDLYVGRITAPVIRREVCIVRRQRQPVSRAAAGMASLAVDVLSRMVKDKVWQGTLAAPLADIRKNL
jgi:LysR family nitrogen assimilation transcriptional regulator